MKRISYSMFSFILIIISVTTVHAASISVKASSTNVTVGNNVTITVEVSGSNADAWEYCLNYDTSVFTLTSPASPCVIGGLLAGNQKVQFTLKARASGSTTFSLRDASVLDYASNSVSTTKGSVTVKTRTQAEIEASYSTNADLKSLSVDGFTISPSFSKNETSYTLEVENDVDKVTISGTKDDSGASVTGLGEKELTEGLNKFSIVVTAEKGNKKTYTIEITRKELNPINVTVDNKNMSIVRKLEALEAPAYYSSTEIEIQDEMVPAFKSDITGFILVGLKDDNGEINLYIYDDILGSFELYKQVSIDSFVFIPLDVLKMIDGYDIVKKLEIEGTMVNTYTNGSNEDFVLLYGINGSNGDSNWYKYDTKEGTFQRFIEEVKKTEEKDDSVYFKLVIILGAVLGLTILLLFIMMGVNSSIRKKNNKLIEMLQNSKKLIQKKNTIKEKNDIEEENKKIDKENKSKVDDNKSKVEEENKTKKIKVVEDKEKTKKIDLTKTDLFKDSIDILEEAQNNDTEHLSQRELRRLEKAKQKELEKTKEIEKQEELDTLEEEKVQTREARRKKK